MYVGLQKDLCKVKGPPPKHGCSGVYSCGLSHPDTGIYCTVADEQVLLGLHSGVGVFSIKNYVAE